MAQLVVTHTLQHSADSLAMLSAALKQMRLGLIEANFESTAVKSGAINALEDILVKLTMLLQADPRDFRLVLRRVSDAEHAAFAQRCAAAAARGAPPPPPPPLPSAMFACLLGGVALQPVREAGRCMLFASGTLGPPELLTSELELGDDCVAVSTCHHASIKTQLLPLVVTAGADKRPLQLTFQNRTPAAYRAIGETLHLCLQRIPGGSLCFWPSGQMLTDAVNEWETCGIMAELRRGNRVIVFDPPGNAEASAREMARYRAAATKPGGCALLMAVMRGTASEGTGLDVRGVHAHVLIGCLTQQRALSLQAPTSKMAPAAACLLLGSLCRHFSTHPSR